MIYFPWDLVLYIANILLFCRVEGKITDRSNQAVNTESDHRKEEIRCRSAGKASRLQFCVIDNDAADPSQKEGQQKACKIFVFHISFSFQNLTNCHKILYFATISLYPAYYWLSIGFHFLRLLLSLKNPVHIFSEKWTSKVPNGFAMINKEAINQQIISIAKLLLDDNR